MVDNDLTADEAKQLTQSVEILMADAIPLPFVDNVAQKPKGLFLSCGRGGHSCTGSLRVEIIGNPEAEEVLGPVVAKFAGRDDFCTSTREAQGDAIVDVRNEEGGLWIVRYLLEDGLVVIHSGSPCFHLPDDIWPGDHY
ncbi:hypothetical protein [Microbacterium sp. LMI1-1-1.1]|uniref:hypothetical protein n=1 Tax=Microbacterium sp. LMI1-1-1.1 TaxID=3135223 RepID=UPI003465F028